MLTGKDWENKWRELVASVLDGGKSGVKEIYLERERSSEQMIGCFTAGEHMQRSSLKRGMGASELVLQMFAAFP